MPDWWTYRPHDLLLFSETVYWRLFELANAAHWPLPLVALPLGAVVPLFAWLRPKSAGRPIAAILACALIVTAWAFLWRQYRPINWAAGYAVPFFALEAFLLVWFGVVRRTLTFRTQMRTGTILGWALFAYALIIHPLTALASGRPLRGAEIFALAPDPTVIATLGLLATAAPESGRAWLFPLPVMWCLVSWASLAALGTWEAWLPFGAVALALPAALMTRRAVRRTPSSTE